MGREEKIAEEKIIVVKKHSRKVMVDPKQYVTREGINYATYTSSVLLSSLIH